jgi:AcrR family transcriptional regulator
VETPSSTRERILVAAGRLLQQEGPAAVTTRAVAHEAGVQAPAIYRLFGDKDGLLEAVAEQAIADFASRKRVLVDAAATDGVDPIEDLHAGWDMQLEFGLANPSLFALMTVPGRAQGSAAARAALEVLQARVHRVAAAGRLRVAEELAVDLIRAAGSGTIVAILSKPDGDRDTRVADEMWAAVLARILTDAPAVEQRDAVTAAVTMRALVPQLDALSDAERGVLAEWLDRAIAAS